MVSARSDGLTAGLPEGWRLLVDDRRHCPFDLRLTLLVDHIPWGSVARRAADGGVWRAEQDAAGPLLLAALPAGEHVTLRAWVPPGAPHQEDAVRDTLLAWAGFADDVRGVADVLNRHPLTQRAASQLARLRMSRLPNVQEAVARGVIGQLVQVAEARRSTAQLARLAGHPVPSPAGPLYAWPEAAQMHATPSWALRRSCGVSLRGARAIHAAAQADAPLRRHARAGDWAALDRRLRSLPGVGVWTSAEARLVLGDPDAVPYGDYHLPATIGSLLGGAPPEGGWDDTHLESLLEPFRPHRGRVIRMLLQGLIRKTLPSAGRRAPHAPLSAHRYW